LSNKVIKGNSSNYGAFSLRSIDDECDNALAEAGRQAEEIRREARDVLQQARKALDDLNASVQETEREANKRGFDDGRQQGIKEGIPVGIEKGREQEIKHIRKQTENLRMNLQQIIAQVQAKREEFFAVTRKSVLRFAFRIAEKIVKAHVQIDEEMVLRNIEAAVAFIAQEHKLQIFINPSEFEVVQEFVPQLKSDFPKIEAVNLVPDMNIGRGCCIVRTKVGQIDATIQTQLEEIERQLIPE